MVPGFSRVTGAEDGAALTAGIAVEAFAGVDWDTTAEVPTEPL